MLSQKGPPHGISLFAYAEVSADLAEGDRAPREVLEARGLSDQQWLDATLFWSERMGEDARPDGEGNVVPRVALAFSDAFAKAQDAKKPLPALDVQGWAELVDATEVVGVEATLRERGLGLADYARLVRHWARAIATTPAVGLAYEEARTAIGNAPERV